MNWLGTVTGKFGYSVGQWLPYVKGGFAAADVGSPLQGAGQQLGSFTQGTTTGGWTAGVGFEYQFSPKWSLGLEYLYTDLGNAPNSGPGAPGSGRYGMAPVITRRRDSGGLSSPFSRPRACTLTRRGGMARCASYCQRSAPPSSTGRPCLSPTCPRSLPR